MSTDREPKSLPRKYTGLRVALGFAAGMTGVGAGCAVNNDGKTVPKETTPPIVTTAPQPDLTQPQLVPMIPAVSAAEIPTLVPTPKSTEAPVPTATQPATATARPAEPSPSATATVKIEPSNTPTTTLEKPKSAENPLPHYGVASGDMTDPQTGKKVAELVIASIPRDGSLDEVFFYLITSPDAAGARKHGATQLKFREIKGTHFQLGSSLTLALEADYDEKNQTLAGIIYYPNPNGSKFKLRYVGTGKETIFKEMSRIISEMSSDQPTTPEKELNLFRIKTSLWP